MVYFVSTPIGNLKDITFRAVETLKSVDAIFCEDTRHSIKLLNAYETKKPLFALHKFNEREAAEKVIAAAKEGKEIAIISDAGMPVISDPGNLLAQILKEEGVEFTIIPGANAALSALVLSALPAASFTFLGFLPDKKGERERLLENYARLKDTLIFHIAPQDLDAHISSMYAVFGDRNACCVREITKLHEQAISFRLAEGLVVDKRGEFVVLVAGEKKGENPLNHLSEIEHIRHYMSAGLDKKEATKRAAQDRGVSKSELYKFAIEI